MLQIRDRAMSVAIDTYTGDVTIRYTFPIKPQFIPQFESVKQAYNITIDSYMGRKSMRHQCTYIITAPSNVAFTTFRIVQKQLMILSRECKIDLLKQQVLALQS